ncbi:MAG: hypothetical protein H6828_03615 [Planctomycetes bacterium]|nr:hypothetical protein [Planctomycetota bacterium]
MTPVHAPATTPRDLIHEVNNFLSLVMTTSQVALDPSIGYEPERALRSILEGAGELTAFVRAARAELLGEA